MMADSLTDRALPDDLRAAWHRFVDELVPLRPTLHSYCRRLTGSIWDAEDLAQETLLRAFGQWSVTYPLIENLRAYLLRTATNLWIDARRRQQTEVRAAAEAPVDVATDGSVELPTHLREASQRLLHALSPQETAALVLKEAFDMTVDQIARLLATSEGAVKAALHRGRGRSALAAHGTTPHRPTPSRALVEKFVDRFQARDVPGLVALMRDGGAADNVGNSFHGGLDPSGLPHFFTKVVFGHEEWPPETRYDAARMEIADVEGELIVLMLITRKGHESLMTVFRFEEQDGAISRLRAYGFCPETIRAVAESFGLRAFTGLYRAPAPMVRS